MTQQALADKLDISRAAIAAYESGNRSPDLYILWSLCSVLSVSPNYLLGISSSMTDSFGNAVEQTGLSESALSKLQADSSIQYAINRILESPLTDKLIEQLLIYQEIFSFSLVDRKLSSDEEILDSWGALLTRAKAAFETYIEAIFRPKSSRDRPNMSGRAIAHLYDQAYKDAAKDTQNAQFARRYRQLLFEDSINEFERLISKLTPEELKSLRASPVRVFNLMKEDEPNGEAPSK